ERGRQAELAQLDVIGAHDLHLLPGRRRLRVADLEDLILLRLAQLQAAQHHAVAAVVAAMAPMMAAMTGLVLVAVRLVHGTLTDRRGLALRCGGLSRNRTGAQQGSR